MKTNTTNIWLAAFSTAAALVRMTGNGHEMAVASVGITIRAGEDRFFGVNAGTCRADFEVGEFVAHEIKRGTRVQVQLGMPTKLADGTPVDFRASAEVASPGGSWYLVKMEKNDTKPGYRTSITALSEDLQVLENPFWIEAPLTFDSVARSVAERDPGLAKAFNVLLGALRLFGGATALPAVLPGETPQAFAEAAETEIGFRNRFAPVVAPRETRVNRVERRVVNRIKGQVDPETWAAVEAALSAPHAPRERRVTPMAPRRQVATSTEGAPEEQV